jgi:addiction module HigA family antidote
MANDARAGRPGFRPVHPGRILKRNIDALGMTVEAFADHIGTTRQTVHAIIAGRSAVREEMAVRLARAFETTPQFWLNLQTNHVVWEFERLQRLMRIRPVKGTPGGVVHSWRVARAKPLRRSKGQH